VKKGLNGAVRTLNCGKQRHSYY